MYRFVIASIVVACFVTPAAGQSEEDAVMATVMQLFDGMRAGDSSAVRAAFSEGAQLYRNQQGRVTPGAIDGFVRAVGAPKDSIWDERIWDETIHIDDNIASVWTQYAFFLGPRLSHCGIDSFQLVKGPNGWKIFALVDTRRTEGCEVPSNR